MSDIVIAMPQMGHDLFRKYMKSKYVSSLRRAGASVRWIDLENPQQAAEEAAACHGLLLPGGADIDPHLYGQEPTEKCGKPNALRDAAEPLMLRCMLEEKKPVLGICRGMQLINVYFGGTLLQDVSDTQCCNHARFISRSRGEHFVNLTPDSRLQGILGNTALVNSLHHQVVNRLGKGLTVSALCQDGYIEGIEAKDGSFCLAVQWHPEHMSSRHPAQQSLFNAFITACRETEEQQ